MKKYPVIYKGKEYEVRWETDFIYFLTIYEVKEIKILKKFKIKRYIQKHYELINNVQNLVTVSDDDPNYHIEEVKTLFKMWETYSLLEENKDNIERAQKNYLEEWDGVIDE